MPNYLRAYCDMQRAAQDEAGTPIRFVASTEGVKRDGKDLKAGDWSLDNYRANPVVLWVHDYSGRTLPIGRASATVEGAQMFADVTFDQADEFARQVESKYRRGFLSAVSVGWNDVKQNGRTVHDLMDVSAVPVPADPQALKLEQARAMRALGDELLHMLDGDGRGDLAPTASDTWRETAAAMVSLFREVSSDADDKQRRHEYNRLCVAYRKLNRVPPEFMAAKELRAMSKREVDGMFLEGERADPMTQIMDMLTQILTAVQGLLTEEKQEDAEEQQTDQQPPADGQPPKEGQAAARVGAMLSTRNRDDLQQAAKLINGVLERATVTTDNETERGLRAMMETLDKIKI